MWRKIKNNNNFVWMLASVFISLVGVIIVYQLWNKDMNVPIVYNGDGVGAVFTINNFINGKAFWRFENIAAPFGETVLSQDYFLNILFIKILALFTDNTGLVVNLYWLLTYVLTALTMFLLLRKIKVCPEVAMVGAVIYNFLPYHYFRLQHFWLMGCYLIPLSVWLIMDMLDEELFSKEKVDGLLAFFKSKKFIINIFFCILIGFGGIYYAVFTIIIMGIVAIYRAIECKKVSYILTMFIYVVVIALPVVFCYLLPSIKLNYSAFAKSAATRNVTQLDTFGLKLSLLLLPIPGHRLGFLSDFTTNFFATMKGNTETYIVQMGFIMSLGLIISITSLFCTKIWGKAQIKLAQIGQINVLIILVSVVGGLDTFIALFISSTIRCYNRMVVFIAAFSIVCICILMNQMYKSEKIKKQWKYFIIFFVVVFGIWDQTSASFAEYEQYNLRTYEYDNSYEKNREEFYHNKQFVDSLIEGLDKDRMAYLMPFQSAWTPDRISFNKKKACIASYETNWSFCVENVEYQNLMEKMEEYKMPVFLDSLSTLGFSGIIIDKNGYKTDNEFEKRKEEIEKYIQVKPEIDASGLLYFYNISDYKADFLEKYNETDRERLKNGMIASMYVNSNSLMGKKLFVSDSESVVKQGRELQIKQGAIQFGPYISLEKGRYGVAVSGTGFDDAAVWVTANSGEIKIPTEVIYQSSDCIMYDFELEEDAIDIEFLMCNNMNDMIIKEYCYARCDLEKYFEQYKEYLLDIRYFQREIQYGHIYRNIPFSLFWMGDTQCKYSENKILIEKGVLQYGPYITLEEGCYRVIIQGTGLRDAEARVTYLAGNENVEIKEIERTDNYLIYEFELNDTVNGMEFLLINNAEDMLINEYGYERSEDGFFSKSESLLSTAGYN